MTDPNDPDLPTFADVEDAAERLRGRAVMTPLLESPLLNERIGGRVLVKAETLQRTGSFKFRGAYNRISRLSPAERKRGVVAYSSGNHAQGVAAAARLVGALAVIVMPADAPRIKIDGTRALGAEVVLYDRGREVREAVGERIAKERGLTMVPPYDDPRVIAGQGTAGLELAAQAEAADAELDAVLSPCGGGGLIAGCALALSQRSPDTAVYAVEPEDFDDTTRSLAAGERREVRPGAYSFCDALLSPTPGKLTFAINRRLLAGGLVVSDDEVARAMRAAFLHLKLVLEPGGATALAALLAGGYDGRGKTVAVIASGGNVDPQTFAAALERAAGHDPSS
ncbi:MAG: threonine/serine dehydratase [Proteobacteria bacterium]|nr:threonine/serine dehydratase [Pseudomonadota bacterium]